MNGPMDLRLPPHSVEAEQSVIGSLLISNAAFDRIADILSDDDFYRDDHRRIFVHIRKLAEIGKPFDVVSVGESISRSNESDQTGGLPYLIDLANSVASASSIKRHAEIIVEHRLRRKLIEASGDIEAFAHGAMPAQNAVEEAIGLLMPLADMGGRKSEPKPLCDVLGLAVGKIQEAFDQGGKMIGLQTGFSGLDSRIRGLGPGDMVVIAGRPGMGKTTLGLNIAENVCLDGGVSMVFSLEMGDVQLAMRTLSRIGNIELDRLRDGNMQDEHFDKMSAALGRLHQSRMIIDETAALTISQIHARARRIKRKEGKLDLVVIDYLGLVRAPNSKIINNTNDAVSAVSGGIKAMAKELGCPVIALAQLSRKVEERADKRPVMSDLRDSGSIEQDADMVILMYRDDYYNQDSPFKGMAEANIAKHRNGEPGMVPLVFEGRFSRFRDADIQSYAIAKQSTQSKNTRSRGIE